MSRPLDDLERLEIQVLRDGFMTHALKRRLEILRLSAESGDAARRIDLLVAAYHRPYVVEPSPQDQ